MYVLGIPCASHVMIAELVEEAGGEIFTDTSGGTVNVKLCKVTKG